MDAFWDQNDPRLFGIETEYVKDLSKETEVEESQVMGRDFDLDEANTGFSKKGKEEFQGKTIETYFVTSDYGVKRQDVINFEEGEEALLGMAVPYFYFMGQ